VDLDDEDTETLGMVNYDDVGGAEALPLPDFSNDDDNSPV